MIISIVVAQSSNGVIGKGNQLPWHLSNDLKYFKQLTTGHCIIMGKNTYQSIGKALPNRVNIVLTNNSEFDAPHCVVRNSLQQALDYCTRWQQHEVYIIGGAKVYEQALPIVHKLYITQVEATINDGDAYFPKIDNNKWDLVQAERHTKDAKNDYDHIFETYQLRTSEPIIYR
jgi:dihydrofolate reductase